MTFLDKTTKCAAKRILVAIPVMAAASLPGMVHAAGPIPSSGGTLTFVLDRQPPTLLPMTSVANSVQQVGPKIFEGLLTYDVNLNPKPQLAIAWSVAPSGLTYTFKLRPGVKWQDGADFTSADVVFSLMRLKQVHPRSRVTFANMMGVDTPDSLTVIVHFSVPTPYFLTALAASETPMMPRHIFASLDPNAPIPTNKIIGTGPFVLKQFQSHNYMILSRNPNYWDKEKPYLDRLIFRFITDPGARATALETGEVDVADSAVSPADVDWLAKVPILTVTKMRPPYAGQQRQLIFNLDHPQTSKLKVRQAIAHTIDLNAIVNIVQFGQARISPSPITQALAAYYDPEIKPYRVDLQLANSLLDQAHCPRGSGGIRFVLKLRYNYTGDARTAEYIKSALFKIGIRVDIIRTDLPIYVKSVYTDRDFDLAIESLANAFDPTIGVQRIYWSKNFKIGLPYSNGAHYANPRVDQLLEDAAMEPDPSKRKVYFSEFQRIVYDDIPVVNLYSPEDIIIANKRVHNEIDPAQGTETNFADAWLSGN